MSIPFPTFKLIRDKSSFNLLVFEIVDHDWSKYHVEASFDLKNKRVDVKGIGKFSEAKFIPISMYDLDQAQREALIAKEYKDYITGRFTMLIHSRALKIFKFYEEYSYKDFVTWIEGGLLRLE
jgi:hypothetical protein